MQHHFHQLPNGLTIVGEYHDDARSLAAGFFVKTGARDETPEISGVSHFLEHMMFKGTERRTPEDVNREFDAMGARNNAFTSEEETVYYGAVLPRFQNEILDLLADMMRPALRERDFDMEKNVILEEIAMYEDRPQFAVFDLLRSTYFGAHPLGASVLGSTDSIKALTRDQMFEYFSRRYAANNLTLALTGSYDWESVKSQTEALCGAWNVADSPREMPAFTPTKQTLVKRNDKFNRAHIALMAPGFSSQDERRYAASVAGEIIGAGDASRLYWALVYPGIAEAAQIGHDSNDGEGAFYGYILAAPERASEALSIFQKEIDKACAEGLSEQEIERAKRRIASAMVLGAETPMGRLRPVGFDWMIRREQKSPQDALENLLAVTTEQVNALLHEKPFELATTVAMGPLDSL
ncbi:putative Zn-dependent peptidase [Abditibacterium utsteinense]|uniref:Putative Zn-dependent peptidase n=1 Tax=Abditibacterium utsteinense TaxID=1960156 RepID=A0A2S8SX63_9BACT|nr:pitrilysin family protein [Abditibacterium utsteinense]PQV65392.1 putative Zn-dependent peptidase [Abditibacterium utsteinense]